MTSRPARKRRPKFFRVPDPAGIRRPEKFLPLLELIQEFHFINSAQILALSGKGRTATYADLQRLYHNRYLDRYTIPQADYGQGPGKQIYTLDRKGAELLLSAAPDRFGEIYYPKRKRRHHFLAHALMISSFRACLILALSRKKDFELADWKQGKGLKDFLEGHQAQGKAIIPDAYFFVRTPKKDVCYFLEADQGTMTLSRFYEKVKRYREFFRRNREAVPPFFRVITLAPTPKRGDNLRIITIKGDPEKEGSERFWFTDETQFSLDKASQILAPIFRLGKKGSEQKKLSLLF